MSNVKVLSFSRSSYEQQEFLFLKPNGNYETVGGGGDFSFDYIHRMMYEGKRSYPIYSVMVDDQTFKLGDLICHKVSNYGPFYPITKIDTNIYGNIIFFTKEYNKNGIWCENAMLKGKENIETISTITHNDVVYNIGDCFLYHNNEVLKILSIEKRANAISLFVENPRYPGTEFKIPVGALGEIVGDPTLPEAPRSFETNPLFVSEDGMNIFEGDSYFIYTDKIEKHTATSELVHASLPCFASEDSLNEYLLKNSRVLCYNDIVDLQITNKASILEELQKIIKARL